MEVARSEAPAASVDGLIYYPGGLSRGVNRLPAHDAFEVLDPVTNQWRSLAPLPQKRHHLMLAGHGGSLYVFGGLDERLWLPRDNVWRYSIVDDRWDVLDPMPTDLASGAAVTVGDSIYVIAGVGESRSVWEFDTSDATWSRRADLLEAREHIAAAVLDGYIYVSGGRWSEDLASVERYDPNEDEWTSVAPMAEARAGHAMVAVGGRLVAFGGELLDSRRALDSVEIYDTEADVWIGGPVLPTTIHGVGGAVVESVVYMVGGATAAAQANATGDVFSWEP